MLQWPFEERVCLVLKPDASAQELQAAVRMLLDHEAFYRPGGLVALFEPALRRAVESAKPLDLTRREWEVACALALDLDNETMSEVLHMAVKTAESHVHHLYQKVPLQPKSRRALKKAVRDALASLSPSFVWM
jgi:DNA-binding NarL/FixJ family response regulator